MTRVADKTQTSIETEPNGLSYPVKTSKGFKIPWQIKEEQHGTWRVFKTLFFEKNLSNIPNSKKLDEILPVTTYKDDELKEQFRHESDGIRFMWIGHASCLVQMDGITFLTDPIFSERCAPVQWLGPKRYRPVPCTVDELPAIDAVLISHNHYDHLDKTTVKSLHRKYGDSLRWFVPIGIKSFIESVCGSKTVTELSWWEDIKDEEKIKFNDRLKNIKMVLTPARHWCGRNPFFDSNRALWGSWSVIGPKNKFFFGGDTAYCTAFKEIGKMYGPFDLAAIPIGAYHPRETFGNQHVDPKEAFDIHCDINSRETIGIHWGTFTLTLEHYLSPAKELYEVREEAISQNEVNKDDSLFYVINHGQIIHSNTTNVNHIDTDSFVRSPGDPDLEKTLTGQSR